MPAPRLIAAGMAARPARRFPHNLAVRAAFAGLAVALLAPAAPAQTAGRDYEFAIKLYRQGRYDIAAREFRQFLRKYPADLNVERAAFFEGFSLRDGGELDRARETLRAAVRKYPDSDLVPDALYRLALAEEATAGPAAAADVLERLVTNHPDDALAPAALKGLGRVRLAAGDLAGAEAALRKFLATNPAPADAAGATRTLADVLKRAGKTGEAADLLSGAAAGTGEVANLALADLGLLRYGAGEFDAAAEAYTELLGRDPSARLAARARLNRGYAYYQAGRFDEAERDLAAAAGTPEFAVPANLWAGAAVREAGRPADARRFFEAGLNADPAAAKATELRFALAGVRAAEGTPDAVRAAAELYEKVAEDAPESPVAPEALYQAAAARRSLGERAAADALLDRLDRLQPGGAFGPRAALLRARLTEDAAADLAGRPRSEKLAEAERQFAAVVDDGAAPERLRRDALIARSKLQLDRGDAAGAQAAYTNLAGSLGPGQDDAALSDALLFGGEAAVAADDPAAAAELAGRFLELFPDDSRAGAARAVLTEAAAEEDLDGAFESLDAALAAGRTPATDDLALKLADRAVAEMETLTEAAPAAADGATDDRLAALAAAIARVAGPIAEDAAAPAETRAAALTELAWADYYAGRLTEAADQFAAVAERFPDSRFAPQALAQRGIALDEAGQTERARVALKLAVEELAPAGPVAGDAGAGAAVTPAWLAGVQLAKLHAREGRTDEADAAFARLNRLFPNTQPGPLLWAWAQTLYRAGRYDGADGLFARLVAEAPDHPQADYALLLLAESDALAGRPADAAEKLTRLVEPAADEPIAADRRTAAEAAALLAEALVTAGEPGRAAEAAADAAERFADSALAPKLKLLAAQAEANVGRFADARARLDALRAELGADPAVRGENGDRPDWLSTPWMLGAELALAARDHRQVDVLAAELAAWDPPPADLFEMNAVRARSLAKRAPPDLPAAETLADIVLETPAARDTPVEDDMRVLKIDLALTDSPKRLVDARDAALRLNALGTTDVARALGGLQAGRIEEDLGNRDAALREYKSVLSRYPDAPAAAQARARLEELGAES